MAGEDEEGDERKLGGEEQKKDSAGGGGGTSVSGTSNRAANEHDALTKKLKALAGNGSLSLLKSGGGGPLPFWIGVKRSSRGRTSKEAYKIAHKFCLPSKASWASLSWRS